MSEKRAKPIRILYIDDYPLDRALVRDALLRDEQDFELVEANSRAEFEMSIVEGQYDLVLSDFNILGFTGMQVLEMVKKRAPDTPVIIVTGTGSEEIAAEAIKGGASDYVIKSPNHIRRLPHTIQAALDAQRLRKERQKARDELRASEQTYRALFEHANDAIFILDLNGIHTAANQKAADMLGYEPGELIGMSFRDVVSPQFHDDAEKRLQSILAGASFPIYERVFITKEGQELPVEVNISLIKDEEGKPSYILSNVRDITLRKQAQADLQESQRLLANLMSNLPGMAYRCLNNDQWTMIFVSDGCYGLTGYSSEDLVGDKKITYASMIHPDDREMIWQEVQNALEEDRPFEMVYRLKTAEERQRWVWEKGSGTIWEQEGVQILEGFITDITDRIVAEEKLRQRGEELRLMAARLVEVEESERRRLARELHDQVGQSLALLSFNLNHVKDQLAETELTSIGGSLVDSFDMVGEISQSIRNVMDDLRPAVLDDYGLQAALYWFADRFHELTGIKTSVLVDDFEPRLPLRVENALFRITQEALTNIAKHAQASLATIKLEKNEQEVILMISDDGIGFEFPDDHDPKARSGWGMINMRERAEAFGATCNIISKPGQGSQIKIVVRGH